MTMTNRQREQEAKIRAEIERRGLRIEIVGKVIRVCGPGVDLLTTGLMYITTADLQPTT